MWISRYFLLFLVYSFLGWVFETVYAVIVTHKWENRGFLYGPICPIYGAGAVAVTGLMELWEFQGYSLPAWWVVFLISFFGSVVLEYGTSWILEKLFHAYWWDYSNLPFNINGRICLPASLLFGVGGVAIVYGAAPEMSRLSAKVPDLLAEFLGMILIALITMDITLTVSALTNFSRIVATVDQEMTQYMENMVANMEEKRPTVASIKEGISEVPGKVGQVKDAIVEKPIAAASQLKGAIVEKPMAAASQLKDVIVEKPLAAASQLKDVIVEKPMAAASQIKNVFSGNKEKDLEEAQEREFNARVEYHISHMDEGQKEAIRRVKGFRPSPKNAPKAFWKYAGKAHAIVKKRISRRS